MKPILASAVVTTAVTVGLTLAPQPAEAYQIDCAILLCLAGGWPPSAPCAAARTEFIRRITPWPVEPPLQIWRCPMRATYRAEPPVSPTQRLHRIALAGSAAVPEFELEPYLPATFPVPDVTSPALPVSRPIPRPIPLTFSPLPNRSLLRRVADYTVENGVADIDISDPAFDFVRSIQVFSVEQLRQWEYISDERRECRHSYRIQVGRYGQQGDFYWRSSGPGALPEAYLGDELYGDDCPDVWSRAVFIDWRDYQGNYGFEQVHY